MKIPSLACGLYLAAAIAIVQGGPLIQPYYSNINSNSPRPRPASIPRLHLTSAGAPLGSSSRTSLPRLALALAPARLLAQANPNPNPNAKPNPAKPAPSSNDSPVDNRPFWGDLPADDDDAPPAEDDTRPKKKQVEYRDYHICAVGDRGVCRDCLRNLQQVQDGLAAPRNWDAIVSYCIVEDEGCKVAPKKGTATCAPGTEVGVYMLTDSFWDTHRDL